MKKRIDAEKFYGGKIKRIMAKLSVSSTCFFIMTIVLITIFVFSPYEPASAARQFEAGMYKIGTDMDPGEYVLMADGMNSYFCISTDANQDDIVQFDTFEYNAIITVLSDQYLELNRCYAVPFDDSEPLDITGSGMFKIGVSLAAGEYNVIADKSSAFYCVYADDENWDMLYMKAIDTNAYVEVEDGQYLQLNRCHIEDPVAPDSNNTEDTTEDTSIQRTKVDTGVPFDSDCIIDELSWIADASETGKSLETFYDMTGVQPYVYFKAYDESLTTEEEKAEYAENWYEENIDNEGTFLYVYFAEEDSSENVGYMFCVDGYEIASVMDDEAIDIFWDNVDLYWYSDLSTDDMLKQIFDSTAEAIM